MQNQSQYCIELYHKFSRLNLILGREMTQMSVKRSNLAVGTLFMDSSQLVLGSSINPVTETFCNGSILSITFIGCSCPLNITLGFELMLKPESPHHVFRFLMCRLPRSPFTSCYFLGNQCIIKHYISEDTLYK